MHIFICTCYVHIVGDGGYKNSDLVISAKMKSIAGEYNTILLVDDSKVNVNPG